MNIVTSWNTDCNNRAGKTGGGFVVFGDIATFLSRADDLRESNGARVFTYYSPADHFPEFVPYTTLCSPVGGVEDPEPYEITLIIEVRDYAHCYIYADDCEVLDISPVYQSADMDKIGAFLSSANRNPASPRTESATAEWVKRANYQHGGN